MIDILKLSNKYIVRRMSDPDAEAILEFCKENTQYYEYCQAEPTLEQVASDLHLAPPGIGPEDKYYVGFYRDDELMAIMDIIDGYPEDSIAFIGFFMMNKSFQGQEIGTSIIREAAEYLKSIGMTSIRLAIDKGNPQSTHFWKKNGFRVIFEADRDGHALLVAEKKLIDKSKF